MQPLPVRDPANVRFDLKGAWAQAQARPLLLFAGLFTAAWLLVDNLLLQPGFGGADIYYFKDPALNLVQGLGFTSRFTYGNPTFDYRTYSQYPPAYPLLFALFAKLFGASVRSNQLFNSLLGTGAGILGFLALRPALTPLVPAGRERAAAWLLGALYALSLVLGFFQPESDRPDPLAVAMGLSALMLVRRSLGRRTLFLAGATLAATVFVSPFVAVLSAIPTAALAASRCRSPVEAARRAAPAAAGAVVVALAGLGLIALFLPGWFARFGGVASGAATHNATGGGYFLSLLHGDVRGWLTGFGDFRQLASSFAEMALAQAAVLGALAWTRARAKSGPLPPWALWMLALLAASPLAVIVAPYQANYFRIGAVLLLAGAASLSLAAPPAARRTFAVAIASGFVALSLVALPDVARALLVRTTTGPSLARAKADIDRRRAEFEAPGRLFAVTNQTWMLWRQEGLHPLNTTYPGFEAAEARARLSRVVLGYVGSGDPTTAKPPDWPMRGEFALVQQPRLPQIPKVLGVKLSHNSHTWETAVYARTVK